MKKYYFLLSICIMLISMTINAQVGINVTNIDDGSALEINSTSGALVLPRMTDTQMLAIPTPLEGAIVYNKTFKSLYLFNNDLWTNYSKPSLPTILLNKAGGTITLGSNTYYNFPLGSTEEVSIDSDYFEVVSDGKIKIKIAGVYNLSVSFSSTALPAGNRKYVIAVDKSGTIIGYPNRGVVNLPSADYWGTSGNFSFQCDAGENIDVKYVMNKGNAPNTTVPAAFFNIGITKIN